MRILVVTTETGSIYHITPELRIWAQIKQGELVGPIPLRTTMGKYEAWSGVRVGEPMVFQGEGLYVGTRLITTSLVTKVTEIDKEE